jgi:hypothetical protein
MTYEEFIQSKVVVAADRGFDAEAINPLLKPHQADTVRWGVRGGRRAYFLAFGLGKTLIQLETARIIAERCGRPFLIVAPLGVRFDFGEDAARLGIGLRFIRRPDEITGPGVYLTNYETIRDGKLNPRYFFDACGYMKAAEKRMSMPTLFDAFLEDGAA